MKVFVLLDKVNTALAFGEHIACYRAAYLGVVRERHGAGGAARGDGTQGCNVAEHLGQRSLGFHDAGTAAACFHAFHLSAALVKVTDHVAHALLGGNNLYLEDGLQKHGACLFGSFLECLDGAELKRELVGVNRVERAVDHGHFQTVKRISGENAVLHCGLETLLDRGNVFLGNVTALNFVNKLERAFEIVVGGFNADDDVGKLTATTGLLLEYLAEFYGGLED